MSQKEIKRLELFQKISEKRLTQTRAAELLGLNIRHIKRLYQRYKKHGASGLISKRRGKPSNRKYPDSLKELSIALVGAHYHDFGPTLAQEKLLELHEINVSVSTLRNWMIEAQIWETRARRSERVYQPRYRRETFGELIQLDGSPHEWFEDRGPKCTLLVYIDDATSQLMHAEFAVSESTFTYFKATEQYLRKHGKPIAFYSDKHGVFRVNKQGAKGGDKVTQFGRALQDLNIDIICANTCQAKGRVERANRTLQDRLIKEMRLHGISSIEAGNAFLPQFIESYNKRFRKEPLNPSDAHRKLQSYELNALPEIFCWQENRTLSYNLTIQYDKVLYLIEDNEQTRKLLRKRVTVCDYYDGRVEIKYEGQTLPYRKFDKIRRVDPGAIVANERLGRALEFIKEQQAKRETPERSKSCPRRKHLEQATG